MYLPTYDIIVKRSVVRTKSIEIFKYIKYETMVISHKIWPKLLIWSFGLNANF